MRNNLLHLSPHIKEKKITITLSNNPAFIILLVTFLFFSFFSPSFFSWMNIRNILLQNTHIFISAIGVTFIMLGGNLDLSVGYQASLVSALLGVMAYKNLPPAIAIPAVLIIGVCCGAINGYLVSYLRITPVIATLASQFIFRGLSNLLTNWASYISSLGTFRVLTAGTFLGIHYDMWCTIVCALLACFILHCTVLGKYIWAMGDNEKLLLQFALPVKRVKFLSYVIGSLFIAIGAVITSSKQGAAGISIGTTGLEFICLTIMYISGNMARVLHNKSPILNTMAGTAILGILNNGVQFLGLNQNIQHTVTGMLCVLAISSNQQRSHNITRKV